MKSNPKIFVTSDTHFGHENIMEYENRPFSCALEMNNVMIENWNKCVGKTDVVYHLGDVGLMRDQELAEIIGRLNGKKILTLGNHDKSVQWGYMVGFDAVMEACSFKYKHWHLDMSHCPFLVYESHIRLHGHTHQREHSSKDLLHVGVDQWGYAPVELDKLLKQR